MDRLGDVCIDRDESRSEYVELKKEWEAWIRDGEEEREEDEEERFG